MKVASEQTEGNDLVSRDVMALSDDGHPSHLPSSCSPRCASGDHRANTAALGASNGSSPCCTEEAGASVTAALRYFRTLQTVVGE